MRRHCVWHECTALARGEGDTSCSCVHEKAPSSWTAGPTQSEVSQSETPGWTAAAPRCLYKSQELHTHTRTYTSARTHTHTLPNTHVMLCMTLTPFKRCQELLNMLKEIHTLLSAFNIYLLIAISYGHVGLGFMSLLKS